MTIKNGGEVFRQKSRQLSSGDLHCASYQFIVSQLQICPLLCKSRDGLFEYFSCASWHHISLCQWKALEGCCRTVFPPPSSSQPLSPASPAPGSSMAQQPTPAAFPSNSLSWGHGGGTLETTSDTQLFLKT